jgi:lipopolysaccharide export system protein LptC
MMAGPAPSTGDMPGGGKRPRLLGTDPLRYRRVLSPGGMARRRWLVRITKVTLPIFALVLLSLLALWPQIGRMADQERVTFKRLMSADPNSAVMVDARYRGVDEHDRPYTLTAATARQAGPDLVAMTQPRGDVTDTNGAWFMLQADQGMFQQHANILDLSGNVVLYRDDGTRMLCDSATVDLKQGAATSGTRVHAEGPFGTLDAQGWTLTDKGEVMQFTGPAHLVLNGGQP